MINMSTRPETQALAKILRGKLAEETRNTTWFGQVIGRSQAHASQVLLGRKPMSTDEFLRACDALGLDPATVMREATERASSERMTTDGMVDESDKLTERQKTALKRDIARETGKSGNNGNARSELPTRGSTRRSG